ncbi:MAG: hypothetical protein J0H14_07710 [Alphaproteobacteria bacterium]|nr:hypothetical protein [Alphaproteobacteria bacterium]
MRPLRSWRLLGFGLAAAFIFACNLMNVLTPYRAAPEIIADRADWIGISPPSNRAFFRQVIDLPFTPRYAWIAVATDDYVLYVNGQAAAQNQFAINAALSFQHRLSDRAQGVNPYVVPAARAPDLRLATNREWRVRIHSDISKQLRRGRNVLALSLQTADPSVRVSIKGEIVGDGVSIPIDGSAESWHASRTPDRIRGQSWIVSPVRADGWRQASSLGPVEEPLQATAPAGLWTRPLPLTGLTGPEIAGDVRFARVLPALTGGPTQSAWLRVSSTWPYTLTVGNTLAGAAGKTGKTEAYDLSRFLRNGPQRVSIRLYRTGLTDPAMPVVMLDGAVGSLDIAPDSSWNVLRRDDPGWLDGGGLWESASMVPMSPGTRPITLQIPTSKGWWAAEQAFVWAACFAGIALLFRALGGLGGLARDRTGGRAAALWILSLPILAAGAAYLLRLRFKETDLILDFLNPAQYGRSLALDLAMLVLAIAVYLVLTRAPSSAPAVVPRFRPGSAALSSDAKVRLLVLAISLLGFALRGYHIGIENLQADENVSLDAARGVLRTGAPYEISGVLYTRSAMYHYMLAGWIYLFGSSPAAARMMSVIPGVAVIFVTYELAYLATGKRHLAVICALVIAVSPWQINQSRNIRFYQQMQFFGICASYFFLRGFVLGRHKPSQNLFFAMGSLAVVCQEIFVLTFPGFCIAGYLYLRPYRLRDNINVVIGFITMMVVTVLDAGTFTLLCLTRNIGITTSIASIIQFHVINPTAFINTFFLSELHARFIGSVFFFAALPFWIRRSNAAILTLYILVITSVLAATVLVMQVAARYVFVLNPMIVIVFIASVDALIRWMAFHLSRPLAANPRRFQRAWIAMATPILAIMVIADLHLDGLMRSYDQHLIMQHESAYRYIAEHRRPGDVVISVSPMSGAVVLGGIDYYLEQELQFDEVYMTPFAIVDRWAGGKLVSKIDQVRDILSTASRAWIIMDQAESKKFTPDFLAYLYGVTQPRLEFLGGELLLWTASDGTYVQSKDSGGSIDDF